MALSAFTSMLRRAPGQASQDLLEPGDGLAPGDAGLGDLGVGEVLDLARTVGHPVEGLVVEGEQDTVGGGADVGLEVAVAQADGVLEGREGVLRTLAGPTTVGERDRPGVIKELMRG